MPDCIEGLIHETPDELLKGQANTPAADHLFDVDDNAKKLDEDCAEIFHHLTAKLLHLCK